MSDLRTLQHAFWSSVRTSTISNEGLFRSRGELSGAQRMAVYRTSYWVRQVSALRALFPSLVATMGDEGFARTASHFIAECPGEHWAIEASGSGFSTWLAPRDPALAQLAGVDWVRFQVFVAPTAVVLTAQRLQQLELFEAALTLGAHVGLAQAKGAPLAIWRSGFDVREASVTSAEAEAMRAAERTTDFETWCELMTGHGADPLTADALAQRLHLWLQRGWLIEGTR